MTEPTDWSYLDEPVDWTNEHGRSSTYKDKWHPEEDERPLRPDSKETTALELWKRWFNEGGKWEYWEDDGYHIYCFFCGDFSMYGENIDEGHADDCIYIAAKKLIGGE